MKSEGEIKKRIEYWLTRIQRSSQPRRYRQPDEKDGDSMTSFVMERFVNVDGRGFQEQQHTTRSWRRLLQGPVVEIDNKVP